MISIYSPYFEFYNPFYNNFKLLSIEIINDLRRELDEAKKQLALKDENIKDLENTINGILNSKRYKLINRLASVKNSIKNK